MMNFQCRRILNPLKVFVTNPLGSAAQLIIVKIMSGGVFGSDQLIDLILIVYSNEVTSANAFRLEIESCAFSCTNSIRVSSDMPRACDGDVFCFLTNFNNPNNIEIDKEEFNDQFDALYLIIKLANSFTWSDDNKIKKPEMVKTVHFGDKITKATTHIVDKKSKPIIMADGIVALDILKSLSLDIPLDILFCPTPITTIAKTVLADYLNVQCNVINEVLVWAANDEIFHVEVEKPLIVHDVVSEKTRCQVDMVRKDFLESRCLDTTQFSASWMKKDFIEKEKLIWTNLCKKVASSASKNPYGCIYRAAEFSKTLRDIWLTRTLEDNTKVYINIGVISDGSLGTIKGFPYVLPVVFDKDVWNVDKRFVEDTHLKQEIKRINKAVQSYHQQLIPYCKKFLQDHVIKDALSGEEDSVFMF